MVSSIIVCKCYILQKVLCEWRVIWYIQYHYIHETRSQLIWVTTVGIRGDISLGCCAMSGYMYFVEPHGVRHLIWYKNTIFLNHMLLFLSQFFFLDKGMSFSLPTNCYILDIKSCVGPIDSFNHIWYCDTTVVYRIPVGSHFWQTNSPFPSLPASWQSWRKRLCLVCAEHTQITFRKYGFCQTLW